MSPLAPLPPAVTHTSTRLTHAEAAAQLSAFLTQTDAHPAYRPDSTLSAAGPISSSSSGTNLTLAHLRRVLTGLQGRRVGRVLSTGLDDDGAAGQGEEEEDSNNRPAKRPRVHIEVDEDGQVIMGEDEEQQENASGENNGAMRWQEKDDFELAQGEVHEDVAEEQASQPAVGAGSGSGEVVSPDEVAVGSGKKRVMSKEERKREKKERWAEAKRKADELKRKAA